MAERSTRHQGHKHSSSRGPQKQHRGHNHQQHRPITLRSPSKLARECICGRGMQCVGMTQAFRMLGDPRCYYVELPRFRKDPPAYKYKFRNNLRAAYLRHLDLATTMDSSSPIRRFVALHHFHPAVVRAFYENPLTSAQKHRVPISITEHELKELHMQICADDRILSVTGVPTGGYYFCPAYPSEQAHEDLKILIKAERASREAATNLFVSDAQTKVVPVVIPNKDEDKDEPAPVEAAVERRGSVPENISYTGKCSAKHHPEDSEEKEEAEESSSRSPQTKKGEETKEADDSSTEDMPPDTSIQEDDDDGEDFNVVVSENSQTEFDQLWEEFPAESSTSAAEVAATAPPPSRTGVTETIHESGDEDMEHEDEEEKDPKDTTKEPQVALESTTTSTTTTITTTTASEEAEAEESSTIARTHSRETSYPWEPPNYRRNSARPEMIKVKRVSSTPAQFIDPTALATVTSPTEHSPEPPVVVEPEQITVVEPAVATDEVSVGSSPKNSLDPPIGVEPEQIKVVEPVEPAVATDEVSVGSSPKTNLPTMKAIEEDGADSSKEPQPDPPGKNIEDTPKRSFTPPPNRSFTPPRIKKASEKFDDRSFASDESIGVAAIALNHNLPGTDPTLRIQVHNDLIAWESKRRSEMSHQLDFNREQWKAAREILSDGVEEVEFAERLVLGFAKAGTMFADALQAMYDDKLLDDAGNSVTFSFLQNRLQMKRSAQEYSIENTATASSAAEGGQSALLNFVIESQLSLARDFRANAQHMEEEIGPEVSDLRAEIQASSRQLETLGDSIMAELKRSEIEVKNIWGRFETSSVFVVLGSLSHSPAFSFLPSDVFDAMVTGDLMEYSMHGSMNGSMQGGGSQHGGSLHSSYGTNSGSVHGFLTPRGENEAPIVSSVHSPLVKSTFRQLGAVEDGWLIEMYYRSAVMYQRSVFDIAENELNNLFKEIATLEESRFRRLHQLMLAFVPRQRRLFVALPENLKEVLNSLVGLRIDEESLQTLIDESIRDRSHNHLRRASTHRSSIMNRSRLNNSKDSTEVEMEELESIFGNPFESPMVLLSQVAELKPGGLGSIVNAAFKAVLVVVTSEGNFHVFQLPEGKSRPGQTSFEAFKALCPATDFDSPNTWVSGRKAEIVRSLTPVLTLNLRQSNMVISKLRNRQLEVIEEKASGGSRFLKAVNAGAQRAKRCTLRLASAADVSDWATMLEKTKKELRAKGGSKTSRFRF
jgi:hypothetical protein